MKIRPLQDNIVVKQVKEEEKTKGGIFIPDSAKEKPATGEVIAVGKGCTLECGCFQGTGLKKGDRVLFKKFSGTEVEVDGETLLVMSESDILGVIEN